MAGALEYRARALPSCSSILKRQDSPTKSVAAIIACFYFATLFKLESSPGAFIACGHLSRGGPVLPCAALTNPAIAFDAYEGLEDIEEEEDEDDFEPPVPSEEELEQAKLIEQKEARLMGDLGDGLLQLQRLWTEFQEEGDEPNFDEVERRAFFKAMKRDVPKSPSAETVAWSAHALESLGLDHDALYQMISDILIDRSDECEPQTILNAIKSFGNLYWYNDDLVWALGSAVRRQLNDFTQAELVHLANGLMRMGALDNSRHVGLFFEMRKRVNLPEADRYVRNSLQREGTVYDESKFTEEMEALPFFESMRDNDMKNKVKQMVVAELNHMDGGNGVSTGNALEAGSPEEDLKLFQRTITTPGTSN